MVDLNTRNLSAITLDQRWQESVHVIEGRQPEKILAIKNFQATAGIPDAIS